MTDGTRPVTVELTRAELEQLEARAYGLSASIPGIARDLVRTGLAGGDNRTLADRLMLIERRVVALEQLARDPCEDAIDQPGRERSPRHVR